jgi:hypothetical protein
MTSEYAARVRVPAGPRAAGDRSGATKASWCRLLSCGLVLAFLCVPAPAFAIILMSFQSIPGSVSLTGTGTPNATLNFGNVSRFEPLGVGVSRSVGGASYTISTNFGVRVTRLISLSANYTLQARLVSAQALTWRVNGVVMTTSGATVAMSQPFGATVPHTLAFEIPFARPAGVVTTVLEVTAIAN